MQLPAEFRQQASDTVYEELSSLVGLEDEALSVLSGRFVKCFEFDRLPSHMAWTEHAFGLSLDDLRRGESFGEYLSRQDCIERVPDPDLAARVCEFYAGLFDGHTSGPGSRLGRRRFVDLLQESYDVMGRSLPVYQGFPAYVDEILLSFSRGFRRLDRGVQ